MNYKKDKITLAFAENSLSFRIIDNPRFKEAFGNRIPNGFNRKVLSRRTIELADKTREKLFSSNKNKYVYLMIDGGTLNRTRHLNISIGVDHQCFFFKSIRMQRMTAIDIEVTLNQLIEELHQKHLMFFPLWQTMRQQCRKFLVI